MGGFSIAIGGFSIAIASCDRWMRLHVPELCSRFWLDDDLQ
jgi:hypothetical protein